MTSYATVSQRRALPSDRSERRRARENRILTMAAVLFVLLQIGEAVLFVHAVKTSPDFYSYFVAVP